MSAPTTDRGGIQQAIRALRANGWTLHTVNDGEEIVFVDNETSAIDAITAVDEAWLHLTKDGQIGTVFFVLGNEPFEVICDYTTNLTELDNLFNEWVN